MEARRNRLIFLTIAILASQLILIHPAGHAQTVSTGAITGILTDPSGASVPGVTSTATEKATGAKRVTTTDATGSYQFSLLPPGDYQLQFSAQGFKTVIPPTVTVVVTEISTLNVQLVLGETVETVEVNSTVQLVQSQSATLGTVVDSQTMTQVPLSTRNYTQILTMSPGVVADVSS